MTNSLTDELRKSLTSFLPNPTPAQDVVLLEIGNMGYYDGPFIRSCIDELDSKILMAQSGIAELTKLEILALQVLCDSAGIQVPKKEKQK